LRSIVRRGKSIPAKSNFGELILWIRERELGRWVILVESSFLFRRILGFGEAFWTFGQSANFMQPIHTPKLAVDESSMFCLDLL